MAFRRKKQGKYDGPVARSRVPGVPGAWGFYPTKMSERGEVPDYRQPLRWVDDNDDPDDGSGYWEWA